MAAAASDSPIRRHGGAYGSDYSGEEAPPADHAAFFSRILDGMAAPSSAVSLFPAPPLNTMAPTNAQEYSSHPSAANSYHPGFAGQAAQGPSDGQPYFAHDRSTPAQSYPIGGGSGNYEHTSTAYGSYDSADRGAVPQPVLRWEDEYGKPELMPDYESFPESGDGGFSARKPDFFDPALAPSKSFDLYDMFPFSFSLCSFIAFMMPISLLMHLSQDVNVVYWVGHWCEFASFFPAFFLLAFLVHWKLGRPHKPTVLVCIIVPAIGLLVIGDILNSSAADKADMLRSTDCDTFTEKRSLQRSWEAARKLYSECLEETVPTANITMENALTLFRIQDCEEWKAGYPQYAKDWEYLWYLEEELNCAGWCLFGQRLWTYKTAVDSCSVVVSQMFTQKVRRMAKQVIVMSVMIIVGTTAANLLMGPGLRAMGVTWDW